MRFIGCDAYSGFKANERPCQFHLDEKIYDIDVILDQWYEPTATYFKVQTVEGRQSSAGNRERMSGDVIPLNRFFSVQFPRFG